MTNRDYLADWVKLQPPVVGYDRNRGTDGRGNLSPIEDSIINEDGELEYTNPMIRVNFFTAAEVAIYKDRLEKNVGAVSLKINTDFVTAANERKAYYITINGETMPLNRVRYLASTGCDANGRQVSDDRRYKIAVDGPGTFTWTPVENPREGYPTGVLGFNPEAR